MSSHLLARFKVASPDFPEPTLYCRHKDGTATPDGLVLGSGARATFDTTFGVFAAGRWGRLTDVQDVLAVVDLSGRARVELVSHSDGVDTVIASVDAGDTVECPNLRSLAAESLYVAVTALEDGVVVRGGEWRTRTAPQRDVRLGVAITTFNRQEYVLKTIDRLVKLESSIPEMKGHLSVLVVDNARNLDPQVPAGAPFRLVGNPNLGGAGGDQGRPPC